MHVILVGPEFEENLSLRYLAAALREAGHTASLARFDSLEHVDGVVQQVLREQPGLVGLSMVFQVRAREFCELAQALRRAGYTGHVTAGGHFITFAYEPILRDVPELDSVVRQEGEETIVELADAVERGATTQELAQIPGMVVRADLCGLHVAPPRRQVADLDALPFPARDTPPELHLGVPTAYLVSSRGCYADCDYCCIFAWHEAASGKRYRLRSVENVVQEMAILYHERGIRFFVFHDDNFFLPTATGNRKRFEAFRAEIRKRKLDGIGLMLKLRPNDFDDDNLQILKDIGLLRVFVGIENASQNQLKSLGREATIEQIEYCLDMPREFGVYASYNILLFDPYTTLDDVATNLRFMREHSYFPFNWCKVEPYAGTALEKRYMKEGRLRGDYFGYDYEIDDPRARLMYDLLLPAFYYRNFNYYGLANLNIGLGYHCALLKHFYPHLCSPELVAQGRRIVNDINSNTLDLLERTLEFVRGVSLSDAAAIERFGEQLKRDAFHAQHVLSERGEVVLREIERRVGVRQESPVGISEAFTPLSPSADGILNLLRKKTPRRVGDSTFADLPSSSRRSLVAALGSGLVWLLTGCGRKQTQPTLTPTPKGDTPQGTVHIAEGRPSTVAAWERMTLEAVLTPDDAQVIGEPRVTCSGGEIKSVKASQGKRRLRIEYAPSGGSRSLDPNVTVSVAWTVRGKDTDTVVVARAFVHVKDDGSYAFGYETPRPTICEMAAPPIGRGPRPSRGG